MTDTIPSKIEQPSVIGRQNYSSGTACYSAIFRVDPQLLPEAAVKIARDAAKFRALRPKSELSKSEAIAEYRANIDELLESDDPSDELPSTDGIERAHLAELCRREIHGLTITLWSNQIGPIGRVLAEHGDGIVAGLRTIHDQSWAEFLEFHSRIARFKDVESLLGSDEPRSVDAWHKTGSAIARFSATGAARQGLQEIKAYAANLNDAQLVRFQNPEAIRQLKLPKSDTLARWHSIAANFPSAQPWCPTRDELQALADQIHESKRGRS